MLRRGSWHEHWLVTRPPGGGQDREQGSPGHEAGGPSVLQMVPEAPARVSASVKGGVRRHSGSQTHSLGLGATKAWQQVLWSVDGRVDSPSTDTHTYNTWCTGHTCTHSAQSSHSCSYKHRSAHTCVVYKVFMHIKAHRPVHAHAQCIKYTHTHQTQKHVYTCSVQSTHIHTSTQTCSHTCTAHTGIPP